MKTMLGPPGVRFDGPSSPLNNVVVCGADEGARDAGASSRRMNEQAANAPHPLAGAQFERPIGALAEELGQRRARRELHPTYRLGLIERQ